MRNKILLAILILLVIGLGALLVIKIVDTKELESSKKTVDASEGVDNSTMTVGIEDKVVPKSKYDGNKRTIAVVIDNVGDAVPQTGLNEAMIVYEAVVEGSLTRFLAVYKDPQIDQIGPSRSARPYFIDYAIENDSIFVHFGGSDKALAEVKSLGIDNANGIESPGKVFSRTNKKKAPHNALVNVKEVWNYAETKKYRTNTTQRNVLNYVTDEVELADGSEANSVTIPFLKGKVKFVYNAEKKVYERYVANQLQKDWLTGEVLTAKNIIVTLANYQTTSEENNYGRQAIQNVGTLDGYYITDGKAIKIKCKKTSRSAKTEYQDLEGNEIKVNDGNTYIEIAPTNFQITFE